MSWQVTNAQSEDAWLQELVSALIEQQPKSFPPQFQKAGQVSVLWFECEPGVAVIHTTGGSIDDRALSEMVLRSQLQYHGYRQASYSFDSMRKIATWDDIMTKAKRLIQSGQVTLMRNGYNNVVAHVIGDHGQYQTEISREDPQSRAITQWQCDCPWDQYAFQRTRKWKKYEGRPCSHVLATYWASLATPLDEDAVPGGSSQGLPGGSGPAGPMGPGVGGDMPNEQLQLPIPQGSGVAGEQMQIPGMGIIPQQPYVPGVTPPYQPGTTPGGAIGPPNSVSVPGARIPSPANPLQQGGTFSKVAQRTWQFEQRSWELGSIEDKTAAKDDVFLNADMARLEEDEMGICQGKSEAHGAGSYRNIPKNSIGEVLGQDPDTGWVDVNFPIHDSGPMEPFSVRAWIEPDKLTPMPNIAKPGPFIRRR